MRFAPICASSLLLLALSGTAHAAASSRPFVEIGSFAPSSAKALAPNASNATVETAARRVIADRLTWSSKLSLASGRVAPMRDGRRIVKLQQTHEGLDVFGRGATVTFGTDGIAHVIAQKLEEEMPSDVTPAIAIEAAAKAASDAVEVPMDPASGKLVIWPAGDRNVLAWHFYARAQQAIPYAPVVIVDAKTGHVITHYNAVASMHQASVFPSNPVASPQTMNVTMPLPTDAMSLTDPLVTAKNCIDKKTTRTVNGIAFHTCEYEQTAMADAITLDFPQTPAAETDPEDPFAELHLYYHTRRVYDYFRSFQTDFMVQSSPVIAVANLRDPPGSDTGEIKKLGDVNLPLLPMRNAYFLPNGSDLLGLTGNVMIFGQGQKIDFSYDADVIYHEFTHAVVNATIQLIGSPHLDAYGVVVSNGAMNEGLADYFSATLTGDPKHGEYVSLEYAPDSDFTRNLAGSDACPSSIGGEAHQDATLFSSALWDVRSALPAAQQTEFDLAIFAAMNAAPSGDLGFEELAELIRAEVQSSSLGTMVAGAVADAFTARGVFPQCTRVLEYIGEKMQGPMPIDDFPGKAWIVSGMAAAGLSENALGYVPGVFQVHTPIPEDAATLQLEFVGGGSSSFTPSAIVHFGDDPIQFTYDPFATKNQVAPLFLEAKSINGSTASYSGTIKVPSGATSAYVMIVDSSNVNGIVTNLTLTTAAAMSSSSGNPASRPVDAEEGCACSMPGSANRSASAALAGLGALAGLVARRRRK